MYATEVVVLLCICFAAKYQNCPADVELSVQDDRMLPYCAATWHLRAEALEWQMARGAALTAVVLLISLS